VHNDFCAIETADAAARREIGASEYPLVPGGKAVRFVSEARRLSWKRAALALDKDARRLDAAAEGSRHATLTCPRNFGPKLA
jgi:hypothetical protein